MTDSDQYAEHARHLERVIARAKSESSRARSSASTDQITFVNNAVEPLADINRDELASSVRRILADLLEHADDETYVEDAITVLSLTDDIPASLILGTALQLVITEVLAGMQQVSPGMRTALRIAARLLRDESNQT